MTVRVDPAFLYQQDTAISDGFNRGQYGIPLVLRPQARDIPRSESGRANIIIKSASRSCIPASINCGGKVLEGINAKKGATSKTWAG